MSLNDPALCAPGNDYVTCCECGFSASLLTEKHFRKCSGLTYSEYKLRHPDAPTLSETLRARRAKAISKAKKGKSRGPCEKHSQFMRDRWKDAGYRRAMTEMAVSTGKLAHIRQFRRDKMVQYYKDNPEHREKVSAAAKSWATLHPEKKMSAAIAGHEALAKTGRPSSLETRLKRILDDAGIAYEYQWAYDLGIADFKIGDVIVFADGEYWHNFPNGTPKDQAQTIYLEQRGLSVLRLWGQDIKQSPMECLSRIRQLIAERVGSP